MRNKGFFWFLTILLTAISLYQVSFTFVSNSVEKKAEKEANEKVQALKLKAAANGNKAMLPNDTEVDFSQPDAVELAKAAYLNMILKEKANKEVYPVFGSTFAQTKQRSLAFGLDLVGGMSVTMEISVPDLVKKYAISERAASFKQPFESALQISNMQGGDFLTLFLAENKRINNKRAALLFETSEMGNDGEVGVNSSDEEVAAFFRKIISSSMDGVENVMEKRINQFGVAQPNIQKDVANNRLYIELPGVQDEATVAKKLQSTANLQFFETYFPSEISTYWQQASMISRQPEVKSAQVKDSTDSLNKDLSTLSLGNLGKSQKGLADFVTPVGEYAVGFVLPENKEAVEELLRRTDVQAAFPEDLNVKFMWSANPEDGITKNQMGYYLYAIKIPDAGEAYVGGEDVQKAATGYDEQTGKITVDLKMTDDGADKWADMTEANKGRIIAITMDDLVYSAPRVNGAITGGNTQISGSFTIEQARDLAGLLNGGALPAPCVIKELTRVGPSIGAENTQSGLISFGIALLAVFIYMYLYYGKAGLVADISLLANMIFIFGSLASFGAVLTLSGIAGIVLTIGMAVDANVLVYERIREEVAAGKDKNAAITEGYKKALSSILDANITTLLTAVVLKVMGTGPIESFATTLIIGIFTSVFSALIISQLIFTWMMNKGKDIQFSTAMSQGAFKKINVDFVGKRKMFYVISGILVAGSLIAMFTKGLNKGIEFSGGRTYGVKFDKPAANDIEYLRAILSKEFKENGKDGSVDIKSKKNNYYLEITTNYMLDNSSANEEVKDKLKAGLTQAKAKLGNFEIMESRNVSASISKELISSSVIAIVLALVIMFAYILMRFGKWQYSSGAILALAHDVTIVLGAFAIFHGILPFNMDVDQAFIAAILTVIGYSINDTVIIFDRIREELSWKKDVDQKSEINHALNATLSRTINTSGTTFTVLLVMFILGGAAIKGFIFALLIGVIVGTYSSICVATPLVIDFSKKIKA